MGHQWGMGHVAWPVAGASPLSRVTGFVVRASVARSGANVSCSRRSIRFARLERERIAPITHRRVHRHLPLRRAPVRCGAFADAWRVVVGDGGGRGVHPSRQRSPLPLTVGSAYALQSLEWPPTAQSSRRSIRFGRLELELKTRSSRRRARRGAFGDEWRVVGDGGGRVRTRNAYRVPAGSAVWLE
jgi:hypothetical protein